MDLGRYEFHDDPHGVAMGGFGQSRSCPEEVARVAELLEAQPADRLFEVELPDGSIDAISAGFGAEQLRTMLEDGTVDEHCSQEQFRYVLSKVRLELETEGAEAAKKRTGRIFLGILGVGLVGMFWMTATGRGLGAAVDEDEVDEDVAAALSREGVICHG